MKAALSTVTLAAVDCVAHDLTRAALDDCLARADFGGVLVLSDKNILPGADWRRAEPFGSTREATEAYWYDVPRCVSTKHILYVQYDSWVLDPAAWDPNFLEYDYVGAPWWYQDDFNVGNGGFSLRTTKLMNRVGKWPAEYPPFFPEDDAICRRYGARLRADGFKFAPNDVAFRFSFERVRAVDAESKKPVPTFGFHGTFNWPLVLTEEQVEERVAKAPDFFFKHPHYAQMREVQAKLKEQK